MVYDEIPTPVVEVNEWPRSPDSTDVVVNPVVRDSSGRSAWALGSDPPDIKHPNITAQLAWTTQIIEADKMPRTARLNDVTPRRVSGIERDTVLAAFEPYTAGISARIICVENEVARNLVARSPANNA